MNRPNLLGSIAVGILAVAALTSGVAAECSREKLIAAADVYLAAQKAGKLDGLQKLFAADKFAYQENNKVIDITKSILTQPLDIEYNRTTADTVGCATYTQLAALTPKPYVIGTQLHYTPDMSAITMIDSIVATTGALFFNASATLGYWRKVGNACSLPPCCILALVPNLPFGDFSYLATANMGNLRVTRLTSVKQDWKLLEAAARPSRDALQKAVDGYLDLWGGPNATSAMSHLPFGNPCERVEGSRYVTPCSDVPRPARNGGKANGMRRSVVDEVMGSAQVLCSFSAVGNIPDSHEIRIENGKIRYVNTITLCAIDDGPDWGPTCLAARASRPKAASPRLLDA